MPYSNPRYYILKTLRKRVGQELNWPLPDTEAFLRGTWENGPIQESENEKFQPFISDIVQQRSDGGEDSVMDAALDGFLTGDPMDLLQWDEWEDTATGMFMI